MDIKKNIRTVATILAAVNLASLLLLNYGKVSTYLIGGIGWKFMDIAGQSFLLWLVVLAPIAFLVLPFVKDYTKGHEQKLYLIIPVVGFVLQIVTWFIMKMQFSSVTYGLGNISASWGFYLTLLTYVGMIVCTLIGSKDVDFGNEKLNKIVNNASDTANSVTSKVVEKVDKTLDDVKNKDKE